MLRRSLMFGAALVAGLLAILPGTPTRSVSAQATQRCFDETQQCLSGRFYQYWQENGGLPVFGFPLSAVGTTTNESGDTVEAQILERERFEAHPTNAAPYDVLLGRLGIERLIQQGRDWQTFPKADPAAPNYFAETGQALAPEFAGYWQTHGLELGDEGVSLRESVALFGYPISPATSETNNDGDTVLTQWYERARFEYHPNNPDPYKVLLGRLGAEVSNIVPPPPPGPGRIIFASVSSSDQQLWQISPDGSNATNLNLQIGQLAGDLPTFSPDGTRVAFSMVSPTGNADIYVQNVDGSGRTQLTAAPGDDRMPAWSPDGGMLAFVSRRDGDDEIYVMTSNGQSHTRVTRHAAADSSPSWSPDGQRIVFVSQRDTPQDRLLATDLYITNVDGSNVMRLTNDLNRDLSPRWSPDGARIAFTSYNGSGTAYGNAQDYDIYVVNADGSGRTQLNPPDLNGNHVAWSPTGTRLAVTGMRGNLAQLYVIDASGANAQWLPATQRNDVVLNWVREP